MSESRNSFLDILDCWDYSSVNMILNCNCRVIWMTVNATHI